MRLKLGIFDFLKRRSRMERFFGFYEHRMSFIRTVIGTGLLLLWLDLQYGIF